MYELFNVVWCSVYARICLIYNFITYFGFLCFAFVNIFSVYLCYVKFYFKKMCVFFCCFFSCFFKYLHLLQNHSRLIDDGVSASPLTLSRSAVFRKAGSCSCDTFTSPAYMNSKIACRCEYETSFKMIIGCFDGFSCRIRK